MVYFETGAKRLQKLPEPLTFDEDNRTVKLLNGLIDTDEFWMDSDNALLQKFIDQYQLMKLQLTKKPKRNKKGQYCPQQTKIKFKE